MPSEEHEAVLRHLQDVGARFATPAPGTPPYEPIRAWMNVLFTAPALETCEVRPAALSAPPAQWVLDQGSSSGRRLLFLHGGGYISGGIASHRNFAMWVSRVTRCSVLLIDYRLAPEHPFPAAVEDAVQAFLWMRANGPDGPAPAQRSFVLGDSAGGGLALALLLELRDRHRLQADAAVTFSAWTDVSNGSPSLISNAKPEIGAVKAVVDYFSALYLQGADAKDPRASPLFGALEGLPPLLMQVSSDELIFDDSVRFAQKARAAGVDVDLEVWQDLVHVWQGFVPQLPEASQAMERAGKFIREIR